MAAQPGLVTGVLAAERTTADCDVMVYSPDDAMIAVESAADEVASRLGLPANWLNSEVQIRADVLPEGWRSRRIHICESESMRIFAASRQDLIAMKILAGRAQDIEDVEAMKLNSDDVRFVEQYLNQLSSRGTSTEEIQNARDLLAEMYKDE